MRPPVVSVVIPTYRRPELLQRCVKALHGQRFNPDDFEIVIVDDGRDEETRQAVSALARAGGPSLRYLRPPQGRGPAVARNVGWLAAQAPLIAFTDDDTIPQPDWLAEGTRAMQAHPSWAALCGRVQVPRPRGDIALPTDHERMTCGLETSEFVTANAFVQRQALARIAGFDERFQRAWREDSDLQFRLIAEAGPVGKCPTATVLHPVRAERWGVSLRQQRNTFFDALLYKKHPRLYRERIRPVPPWDYYAVVALTVAGGALAFCGLAAWAIACAVLSCALVLRFAVRRLRGADRSLSHVLEMLATSALIPFLSVYWRLRGALRFRVLFL